MSDYDYLRGGPRPSILDKLSGLAEKNKELIAKHYYGHLVQTGSPPDIGTIVNKRDEPMDPLELIVARLRLPNLMPGIRNVSLPNIDHISTYTKGTDVAIVFIVKGAVPVTIQDDPALFPSDSLITQLRLLMADPAK